MDDEIDALAEKVHKDYHALCAKIEELELDIKREKMDRVMRETIILLVGAVSGSVTTSFYWWLFVS